eukprot:TRINITY_DN647_c0_g1_i2.p1 TRINITY_DN647_c0_g1~~TRINITY_DN647_c0_g1_i2.p1  ORF type:complete len:256 (+),score=26.91 TRINITY_DN647_c0_g1_i2:318-1085(+)
MPRRGRLRFPEPPPEISLRLALHQRKCELVVADLSSLLCKGIHNQLGILGAAEPNNPGGLLIVRVLHVTCLCMLAHKFLDHLIGRFLGRPNKGHEKSFVKLLLLSRILLLQPLVIVTLALAATLLLLAFVVRQLGFNRELGVPMCNLLLGNLLSLLLVLKLNKCRALEALVLTAPEADGADVAEGLKDAGHEFNRSVLGQPFDVDGARGDDVFGGERCNALHFGLVLAQSHLGGFLECLDDNGGGRGDGGERGLL